MTTRVPEQTKLNQKQTSEWLKQSYCIRKDTAISRAGPERIPVLTLFLVNYMEFA
jgi:hypothetical protein